MQLRLVAEDLSCQIAIHTPDAVLVAGFAKISTVVSASTGLLRVNRISGGVTSNELNFEIQCDLIMN
ncbi:hypothetical protein [Ruegeria arenilitoris]|uniref:hypothetical protein n=1 Tax=Ruegeria arenilitoris TaxID=1173585 RepID=UPI00147BD10B|nr:hypothetical protein [Ruegeria arenilitoris]